MLSYYTVKKINQNLYELKFGNGETRNMTKKKMYMFLNNMRKLLRQPNSKISKLDKLQERFKLLNLESLIEERHYE